jgi:hypothetical protein
MYLHWCAGVYGCLGAWCECIAPLSTPLDRTFSSLALEIAAGKGRAGARAPVLVRGLGLWLGLWFGMVVVRVLVFVLVQKLVVIEVVCCLRLCIVIKIVIVLVLGILCHSAIRA